ncbi:MAG: hypothetical protein ABIN58_10680, partial [candidate division WOR-3 bacterium]
PPFPWGRGKLQEGVGTHSVFSDTLSEAEGVREKTWRLAYFPPSPWEGFWGAFAPKKQEK